MKLSLKGTLAATLLFAAMSTSTPARAEIAMSHISPGTPDQAFITQIAQGGMTEVQLGTEAQVIGGPSSQKFGKQMVLDHSKANKDLKNLAAKLGAIVPAGPTPDQAQKIKDMSKLDGTAFDEAYLHAMHDDHVATIKLLQAEIKNGKDPQVKAWAAKVLPTIEMHLAMDNRYLATIGGGAGQ